MYKKLLVCSSEHNMYRRKTMITDQLINIPIIMPS